MIWEARFVRPAQAPESGTDGPALAFRGGFTVDTARLVSATLYVTAHGVHEVTLNGTIVGDEVLAPGWSSYSHRLRYATHDVLPLLSDGANELIGLVADGWHRGRIGFEGGKRDVYGDTVGFLAQLELVDRDGARTVIASGDGWEYSPGPIVATGLYDGEHHDARLHHDRWRPAVADPEPPVNLVAPDGPPVRRIEEITPVAVTGGLYDFGQNLVGRVRIRTHGTAGDTVTLRHAEVLEGGKLGVRPLRQAAQTDTYVLGGGDSETWEPRFTIHGFRYVEVTGHIDEITAVVIHSDMPRTGWFECSDPLVNRLHENVVWSMRGNFVDLPTDCPQRDERLGWTGDIQLFAPTATFLYDCTGVLRSWLRDLAAEQFPDGNVPLFVPTLSYEQWPPRFMAAWGDAAVVVPWEIYRATGDPAVLRDQFGSMRAWVDGVERLCGPSRTWPEGMQFGDWLEPSAPPDAPWQSSTDYRLVGTACFYRSARMLADVCDVLGEDSGYAALAEEIRAAFRDAYLTADGRLASDSQTAYALAVAYGILDGPDRQRAGDRLAELVRASDFAIATGFVGTPIVCTALTETGHVAEAYRMLLRRDCPSWLYPVTMGATTVWERWDSMLPDGTINPGEMTSFNHYALGAVADWLHRTVAGLASGAPGWRRLHIRPRPPADGSLTWASARHGGAAVRWESTEAGLAVDVTVPDGVTARLDLPGAPVEEVGPGRHHRLLPDYGQEA